MTAEAAGIPSESSIRASFAKSVLAALGDTDEATRERILARIPAEILERVESSSRSEWLSGEVLIVFDVAIHDELGDDGLIDFWRRFSRASTRVPILRPIADSAIRLFGTPKGIFKMLPNAWSLMTRNFGSVFVEAGPAKNQLRVRMVDVPRLSRPDLFTLGHHGSYLGVLDLVGATGTVTRNDESISEGHYDYDVRWD